MKKLSLIILLSLLSLAPLGAKAQLNLPGVDPEFNPGNIITDGELLNSSDMSLEEIQRFLEKNNSFLSNYFTTNSHGTLNKKAAEIIYEAASSNYDCEDADLSEQPTEEEKKLKCKRITTVNPKFLLVLLQKEQGLIEDPAPKQSQLDWATGYGCPDNWACNPYYKGFGKQVNSAALQFKWYVENNNNQYKYKAGNTYTFTNPYGVITNEPMEVTIENDATAALYNYTPHVFNGNYNVFKLWKKYFPRFVSTYPNGSLLRIKGEIGVWLLEDGLKRPFLTRGALTSRFDEKKIIEVDKSVLDNYVKGEGIKFPNYSLIQIPSGEIYLLVNEQKRLIESEAVFKKIGFNKEEIIEAPADDLKGYKEGSVVTATSTYPLSALLQSTKTGGVYYVYDGKKAPLIDKIFLSTKFKGRKIIKASEETLAKYEKISPVLFDNGELIKSNASSAVYLVDEGKKRPFASGEIFLSLGYKFENIITVSPQLLYLYPEGKIIDQSSLNLEN